MDIKAFLTKPKKVEKPKEEEAPQIDAKVTEYVSGLPQQNFTLAPKQKPKVDKKPIIIAASIVGVLLLGSIIAFIFWPKGDNSKRNNPNPGPEVVEEEPEDEEDEESLNKKLAQKFNTIMSFGRNTTSDKSIISWAPNSDTTIYTKLNFGHRIQIATVSLSSVKENVSNLTTDDVQKLDNNTCNAIFGRACGNVTDDMVGTWSKIDATKVKDKYVNLFGALPDELTLTDIKGCPHIFFDPTADFVGIAYQCGTGPSTSVMTYKYKYTYSIDDRYAYVYFTAGTAKPHENGAVYDLYGDLYQTDFKRTIDDQEYNLTDKNYENFKKYRMTFYKSDHNFIYKNVIEEVEEEVEIKESDD